MTESDEPVRHRLIGLGEVLWDCFPDGQRPGGATSNVAFHATQLDCEGFVVSRVGDDERGRELVSYLTRQGLNVNGIQRDRDEPTGRVTVEITGAGQHEFIIHEDVAWDRLEFTPSLQQLMATADAVCFGTLAQRCPASRETIQRCLFETGVDCLIVFDVNIRQHFYDRIVIERSLQAADIVKLNDAEAELLTDLLELPGGTAADLAAGIRDQFGVDLVCITRGDAGCTLSAASETVSVPGVKIDVVDTVGAGDAFTAALIISRLEGWPLVASAEFANRVGALVASHAGAMPVLVEEFQQLRNDYKPE
ncbi:MAG: carbohydrate kinase [Planctomycetota bacterium]|nr:carbohydrate kinase [Planctomycetota bacterium]MDA1164562.1 carbohydrate kinase [Planctomycetota bacterium]